MTVLTKPVRREIEIEDAFGRRGPVILTVTGRGLELRAKGRKRKLFFSFSRLRPDVLPGSIPGAFASNPLGWLVDRKAGV